MEVSFSANAFVAMHVDGSCGERSSTANDLVHMEVLTFPDKCEARMVQSRARASQSPGLQALGPDTPLKGPEESYPLPIVYPISSESARHAASWRTARSSFEHAAGVFHASVNTPCRVWTSIQTLCLGRPSARASIYIEAVTQPVKSFFRLKYVSAWQEPWQPALLQAR